jgi:glycosyltransferase involved in cell wall biosynthesis
MKPFFSIISPVLNGEDYIARSYWCLRNQSVDDWEWIVVDDGSQDRTAEEVSRIRDERIRLIRLGVNKGRGFARTAALGECRGEWVVVWDIDDIYFPDRLAQTTQAVEFGKEFCVSGCVVIDRTFNITGQRGFGRFDDGTTRSFLHPTLSCRREQIQRIGYETAYSSGEDFRLIFKLSRECDGSWSNDPVIAYREDSNPNKLREAILSKSNQIKYLRQMEQEENPGYGLKKAIQRAGLKRWALSMLQVYPPLYKKTFSFRSHGVSSIKDVLSQAKRDFLQDAKRRLSTNSWT